MNCAAVPRCIPAGTMPPSPLRPSRLRIPCSQGTRRAIESENDSLHPFSQGLAAATGIDFAPTPGGQFTKIAQLNSDPWSLLMRLGAPRRPTTRAKVFRKSAHVRGPDACNTRHSRVYLSTKVSHLSGRPPAVRSWVKSEVQASFLNRAGC